MSWRNYHEPARKPQVPPRTREAIAARNRAMQQLASLLKLKFRPMRSSGNLA